MRVFAWGLAAALMALALFEISMQPSWGERLELGLIFVVMALSMAAAARWLPAVARRYRSIRVTVAVLALAAFSIVILGALAVGNRMFLSSHDLTLLLVVIAFGIVSAVGFALAVSKPLTEDLDLLSTSAGLVASGDLTHELSLDRQDEIGRLSVSLDEMVSQLETAESARRDFFAAVGHDLRTPLASIRAATESIRDGVASDPDRALATIERDITVLTNLIEDVYLLARVDAGAVDAPSTRVDVTELADETLELLRPIADAAGVELVLLATDRFTAYGSATWIGRVLRNLVDNAIRFSPPHSTVTVAVKKTEAGVEVSVIDQGPGFDPRFKDLAFNRFSRPEDSRDRSSGGSGLGLAIAKSLVVAMDGTISIDDGPGGRLELTLPAS